MTRRAQLHRFNPMARLRRLRGVDAYDPGELKIAVTRLAHTPDGQVLLGWLEQQTHGKILLHDAPDSALRELMAHRSLFDRILKLIEEPNDGGTSADDG